MWWTLCAIFAGGAAGAIVHDRLDALVGGMVVGALLMGGWQVMCEIVEET